MEQQNSALELSPLEATMLDLQAQGAAVALYGTHNNSPLTQDTLTQESVRNELNANYLVAFEYLAGIYSQQPKQQEVMKGLESKISATGSSLEELLQGGEEDQALLNGMYAKSITDTFGNGEEGAMSYIDSHLEAQKKIDSTIAQNSDKISEDMLQTVTNLSKMYTGTIAQQAQEIFGMLPAQYQHLLENPANDNSAPVGYNPGDRDAA